MLRPALAELFSDYREAHRDPINQRLHRIAIPLIMFSGIAMFDWWTLFHPVTAAHVGILLASAWYLRMDAKLGLIMVVAMVIAVPLGRLAPWWSMVMMNAVGWTLQLLGHALFEKNSPAFMRNFQQTLVGPIFFIAEMKADRKEEQ